MMERGKGDGKGNDGQRTRWREEKGDGKGNDGQGGRRSEKRGTVKHRRKRER